MRKVSIGRLAALAGLIAIGAAAQAFFDPTIAISQALGSSSLSVHYSGAHVRTVEFIVNGQSMASRTVDPTAASGNAYFSIDASALQDGENKVVIKLYNAAGKLIGTKKSVITAGASTPSPFFLSNPKMGQSVQGSVKISVGMTATFNAPYVSFFIDNKLRSFSNTPPFQYFWDTTREANGWHTVQSWLVDSDSTYKTQTTKVFVNNPGGLTPRVSQPEPAHPDTAPVKSTAVPAKPATAPTAAPVKPTVTTPAKTTATTPVKPTVTPVKPTLTPSKPAIAPTKPEVLLAGKVALNPVTDQLTGRPLLSKPVQVGSPLVAGPRHQVPAVPAIPLAGKTALATPSAISLVSVTNGTRIGYAGAFSILLNGAIVPFDVQPRVDAGIPMTPIRYLIEHDGGIVKWDNSSKTVTASDEGISLWLRIGSSTAKVNKQSLQMEKAPYIDGSRTIVPLSFIHDALHVDVQYDKTTNHVLITTKK